MIMNIEFKPIKKVKPRKIKKEKQIIYEDIERTYKEFKKNWETSRINWYIIIDEEWKKIFKQYFRKF